jgi:hypothetical protein
MQVDKSEIPADNPFITIVVDGLTVYLDKALQSKTGEMVIDIAGWGDFKRLIVAGIPVEPSGCKEC